MKEEAENKILLQQVIDNQKYLASIYDKVARLESENKNLQAKLAVPPTPALPSPSDPTVPSPIPPPTTSLSIPPVPPVQVSHDNSSQLITLEDLKLLKAQQERADLKTTEVKFPKFSGKSKEEFRVWYDSILAILASPAWKDVYSDLSSKTLKTDKEIPESLNLSLFVSLKTCLTGNAATLMMSKPSTWGHGLTYLSTIKEAYRERLQPADLLDKRMEYLKLFKKSSETYDDFAARCIKLRQTLLDHNISSPAEELRTTFIMGLGPLFTDIQQTNTSDLPARWQTTDMEVLTRTADAYSQERLAVRRRNKKFREANKELQTNQST